jgi:FkbM family methyltransferase
LKRIAVHPANQGRVFPAIVRYLAWQLSKRTYADHWDIPYHGLTLRCHRNSHSASGALYFNGMPDFREMTFIQRYLRPGDTFVDIGANVGVYTLLAAALVGARGRVHAFEPGAMTRKQLNENVALNRLSCVSVHGLAVSDRAGSASLTANVDDCVASLVPVDVVADAVNIESIECVTLDGFLPDVDFAMAKPMAIRGALGHLSRGNPPVLQIEMDGYSKKYGVETHEFIAELDQAGYDVGIYDVARNSIEFTRTPWVNGVLNVLAVSRARRSEVVARLAEERSNP